MADKFYAGHNTSSATLYLQVRDSDGNGWNGANFAEIIAWTDFDISLSQEGSSFVYSVDFPSGIGVGRYTVFVFEQLGASPAEADMILGMTSEYWTGSEFLDLAADIDTAQTDLNKITGADGATLATSQPNYAPAKAGDAMDVTEIGGDAQSATDLKDLVDTGYDPVAHKVTGVVLADTVTTNTDMRGTDSAATVAGILAATIDVSTLKETLRTILAVVKGWVNRTSGAGVDPVVLEVLREDNLTVDTELTAQRDGSGRTSA